MGKVHPGSETTYLRCVIFTINIRYNPLPGLQEFECCGFFWWGVLHKGNLFVHHTNAGDILVSDMREECMQISFVFSMLPL